MAVCAPDTRAISKEVLNFDFIKNSKLSISSKVGNFCHRF